MARGLFELRKDSITGWWVAVVVDREFDRARFHRPAKFMNQEPADCANCHAEGEGVRVRMLKPRAFTVAGTEREAREQHLEDRDPELGLVGDSGSWQTIIAPAGHHEPFSRTSAQVGFEMLVRAREQIAAAREAATTEYVQVVQNWGRQAGARTDHLCLDFYDLPQIPHRIGEELGGAARYLIREGVCPFCRLVRDEVAEGARLVFEDATSVCFAPYASRSPFELWVVPRHHAADFSTATDSQLASAVETLQRVLGLLGALDGPPYNLLLHTAPLKERVDETYHWHWEIHPRLREIAGLELGTGLPVNPVSPEEAVTELLELGRQQAGADGPGSNGLAAPGPRSWDSFPRDAVG
jgi:UDPglucose--hexose-1-phosphate uridylyltransferase